MSRIIPVEIKFDAWHRVRIGDLVNLVHAEDLVAWINHVDSYFQELRERLFLNIEMFLYIEQ